MTNPASALMSRDEVAAYLSAQAGHPISPDSVRKILGRYGVTEIRGYPRAAVEAIERPGRGSRKRFQRIVITLDDEPGPMTGDLVERYAPGARDLRAGETPTWPVTWTARLDGHIGVVGARRRVSFTAFDHTYSGTAEIEAHESTPAGRRRWTTLVIRDVREEGLAVGPVPD